MATDKQIVKALKHETERFKRLRDNYDDEGKMKDSNECHLVWYYLSCCLDGISFALPRRSNRS